LYGIISYRNNLESNIVFIWVVRLVCGKSNKLIAICEIMEVVAHEGDNTSSLWESHRCLDYRNRKRNHKIQVGHMSSH